MKNFDSSVCADIPVLRFFRDIWCHSLILLEALLHCCFYCLFTAKVEQNFTGVTYTGVVVYLRRTLEGPFLHLFFWGVLKLFSVHFFGGFLWPEFFPRKFYPQKIKKIFF